jgi:hypothetical protein
VVREQEEARACGNPLFCSLSICTCIKNRKHCLCQFQASGHEKYYFSTVFSCCCYGLFLFIVPTMTFQERNRNQASTLKPHLHKRTHKHTHTYEDTGGRRQAV